jgi:hypothetical protein
MVDTTLAFLAFALLGLVLPGRGLQRLLGLWPDPALNLPLGLAVCAAAYALSLVSGWPWLFLALVVGLSLCNLARFHPAPLPRGASPWGALLPWLACLALFAATQFPWNRRAPDGSFLLDPIAPYDDAVFHVGLARELTLGFPPQVPGLSGVTLGYHFGQGLARAAALRFLGIEPYDLISRFDPALLALGLILALRALAAQLGFPPLGVTLAGWSPLFTDFSFLFAANPSAFYWADLLKGNLLLSLAYVNPVVPGLLLALGVLLALARFEAEQGRGFLVLAALLAMALPHFKVFLGAHLLLGLGVAGIWASGPRRRHLLAVAAPCALMTALLARGRGGAAIAVSLAPFDLARITRESLDLPPATGLAFVLWCALWLFASLGLRWLGLPAAVRALRDGPRAGATLAAMALLAWPIGLAFRIAVADALPDQKVVNDAAYLVEQGGPLLWLFAAAGLAAPARRHRPVVVGAVLLLALPSTVQLLVRKAAALPDRLPAPMVRAVDALRAVARPGDVVLQRPAARYPPAPVLLANLRVPYERYTPFRTQFASKEALERRHRQLFAFFRTEDPDEARAIARELNARFVALYGSDRVRFGVEGVLEPVYREEGSQVYRVR